MMRRAGWGAALAVAAAITTAPVLAQETTLRFYTIFDAGQNERWAPIIEAYQEANPGVSIMMESISGSGAAVYPDVLRTSMASGDPPDVFFMWGGELAGPFIQGQQALPLDTYYEQYAWRDRFASWMVERLERDGKMYGVPFRARGMGFWYRTDLFEEYDLKVPTSYDELAGVCATLKENGIYCATFGGRFGWHTMRLLDYFIETECGPEIHDGLNTLRASWDQPCVVAAYATLRQWVEDEWLVPDFLNVTPPDARLPMYLGDAAMIIETNGFEVTLDIDEQDIALYDFFLPPTGHDPQRYPAFPEQWMIAADSGNPDAAAAFVDWITRAETQKQYPSAFAGTATSGVTPDCEVEPRGCRWSEILNSDRQTYVLTDQAFPKELVDAFFEVQDAIVAGRTSPEDGAKRMEERAQQWKARKG
ncbi:ABC transporter substrate-binding protein [Marinivivus vitaminiproducens]|uniref:ABC transporter substrate-binding protein n=1 Tax=Marinivivus vitaminiproducens TaxID=3035935 RepID=UPI00279BB8B4|nr:ABC transporter substrate-binding protein [Geminicoccaceae bacterium SCSIO 64248]